MLSVSSPDHVPLQVRDGLGGPAGLLSDLTANEKTRARASVYTAPVTGP